MKISRGLNALKDDRGYVFIEASIVYPIMFFIIVFLMYTGNMYLLKARIHSEVSNEAIKYANYFSNPLIKGIENDDYKVKTSAGADLTNGLYRYLYKRGTYASQDEIDDLATRISRVGLFTSFQPHEVEVKAHSVNNYILYHTYLVEVNYKITFPIKMIFEDSPWTFNMSAREEAPVTDQSEFIRNVDMTIDYLEHTKTANGMLNEYSKLVNNAEAFIKQGTGED